MRRKLVCIQENLFRREWTSVESRGEKRCYEEEKECLGSGSRERKVKNQVEYSSPRGGRQSGRTAATRA